jgi:hypothetical protein
MSQDYKTITDNLIALLEAERTDKLSEDMADPVASVKKGQYMPTGTSDKAILYACFRRSGVVSDLAGGMRRRERLMFLLSGGISAATQESAHDEGTNFINNIQQVLMRNSSNGYWSGGMLGWGFSDDEANPELSSEYIPDPGTNICTGHIKILWSCEVTINLE